LRHATFRTDARPMDKKGGNHEKTNPLEKSGLTGSARVLAVDDEAAILVVLRETIERAGPSVIAVTNERDALQAAKAEAFDLAIVDLRLGGSSGIALMEELLLLQPDLPVIILTGYGTIEAAVEAMKHGAYGFLAKPFKPAELIFHIEKALENRRLIHEVNRLKDLVEDAYGFTGVVTRSKKMHEILSVASRAAAVDSTVYIHGESGTGKELIAKTIHVASYRKEKPFIPINCAALPEPLLESMLFGHEKGAFTGAVRDSKGVFVQAHQGTLFLDEIGDMSLAIQAKILRVLQERKFYPIGSDKVVEVDVRIIVATNKDLREEVKRGAFRDDLFYRIHVIPIYLPPLRERREDIPALVRHFLGKLSEQKKGTKTLTAEAMRRLMLYDWPGNIRELQNVLEYGAAMAGRGPITENLILPPAPLAPSKPMGTLKEARLSCERDYLIKVLQACRGNVSEAATISGKCRADFYAILQKHNMKPAEFRLYVPGERSVEDEGEWPTSDIPASNQRET
jgi:two-component system, NtrC family, response regulator GlrR